MNSGNNLLNGFQSVLNALIPVIFAFALVFFFWGLAKLILHAGEEEAKEEGKRLMFWGVIGLVVMFGLWGIVNFLLDIIFVGGPQQSIQIPPFPSSLP